MERKGVRAFSFSPFRLLLLLPLFPTRSEKKERSRKKKNLTGSQGLVERNQLHPERGRLGLRGVRVVGHHVEAQALAPPPDLGADLPESNNGERLAHHRDADELGALPLPLLDAGVRLGHVAGDGREQRDAVLCGGDGVGRRRVDDEAAGGGGGLEVDVVDADARAADDLQAPARRGKDVGGDLRRGADDEGVGGLDLFVELLRGQAEGDVDVAKGLELGQAWKEGKRVWKGGKRECERGKV